MTDTYSQPSGAAAGSTGTIPAPATEVDESYDLDQEPGGRPLFRPDRSGPLRTVLFLAFAAILVLFPYWAYLYTTRGRLFTAVMGASLVLAIAAIGLNILAGYTGMLSLGQGAFMAAGGFVMVKLGGEMMNPWLVVPLALAWGGICGWIVAIACGRLKGLYLSIVTFLVSVVIPVVTILVMDAIGGQDGTSPLARLSGITPPEGKKDLLFAPQETFDKRWYMLVVVILLLAFVAQAWLVRSGVGRAWMAIRDSDIAARACGINVPRYRILSFVVSAEFAAVAGILFSQDPSRAVLAPSDFGFTVSFTLVFFLIFGGIGTLPGPLVGAISLGFVADAIFRVLKFDEKPGAIGIIFGVLLIVNMVFAPRGVMGILRDIKTWYEGRNMRRGIPPRRPSPPVATDEDRTPRPRHTLAELGGQPILELREVAKVFGGLRAVDSVTVEVPPGSIHSLIGPNGSGKTTTINLITGFYQPEEGRVYFRGEDVTGDDSSLRAHRGMTRTFQNLQVFQDMTVLQNVMVGMQPRMKIGGSFFPSEDDRLKRRAYGLLDYVGLAHRWSDPGGKLAYAERRRLEIARALAADPDLLLLDEPAAGMNPSETNDLTTLIRDIADHGITVMLIEHHMDLVMQLSDAITVLDYGSKIAEGTPEQVQANPRVVEAYLGAEA